MRCSNCGSEFEEGIFCPECGFKRGDESAFAKPESKEFHFVGVRGRVDGNGLSEIYTDAKIKGNGEVTVSYRNKIISSDKTFCKQDVAGIDLPVLPVWSVFDWIRIIVFSLLVPFTFGLALLSVIFSIKLALSRQIRIRLNSGKVVKIPIGQKAEASEFLGEFNYSPTEIQKNNEGEMGRADWLFGKKWTTRILFYVTFFSMIPGFFMYVKFSEHIGKDKYIQMVQEMSLEDYGYPNQTYGEAFESFFESPDWEYFKGDYDDDDDIIPEYDVVEFTGDYVGGAEKVNVTAQFTKSWTGDTFELQSLSLDGVSLAGQRGVISGLIWMMCEREEYAGMELSAESLIEISYVKLVKLSSPELYPDQTYGEVFESFFELPAWEYFKGTLDGDDTKYDVVEFTGDYVEGDEREKIEMQFIVDTENDFSVELTYLSVDDILQDDTMIAGLIELLFGGGE